MSAVTVTPIDGWSPDQYERFRSERDRLQAFVDSYPRAAAREADAALARGERRPLLGIPMTVKESFNVAGLPTTWGFPHAAGWIAADDAELTLGFSKIGLIPDGGGSFMLPLLAG